MKRSMILLAIVLSIFVTSSDSVLAQEGKNRGKRYYSLGERSSLCGVPVDSVEARRIMAQAEREKKAYATRSKELSKTMTVPNWRGMMSPVEWQACRDCWAHAATGTAEGQLHSFLGSNIGVNLDEMNIVENTVGECRGDYPYTAWGYIGYYKAISAVGSYPNLQGIRWGIEGSFSSENWGVFYIKQLLERGPVSACFLVFDEFWNFFNNNPSGVYHYASGDDPDGHAVVIVSYDEQGQYWLCKNSWGYAWGDDGYFRIGWGECGIDTWNNGYVTVDQSCIAKIVPDLFPTVETAFFYNFVNSEWAAVIGNTSLSEDVSIPSGRVLALFPGANFSFSGHYVDANGTFSFGDGCAISTGSRYYSIYPSLATALSVASGGQTVSVNGTQEVDSYLSVSSGISLRLNAGSTVQFSSSAARLVVAGSLYVNGSPTSRVSIDGLGHSRSGYLNAPIVISSGGSASVQCADFTSAAYLLTVYNSAGNVCVQNSTFSNFGSTSDAKAITVTSVAGTTSIASNSITGSNQGFGVYSASNGTNVSITGNTITNCGTGIRPYASNASITGNIVRNNVNYGILADNVTSSAEYDGNDIRGNGYGLFLNSSSPMVHHNTIIQNGSNVYMSSSSPVFGEPSEIHGHNVIAMASSPLVNAQNSSSPCLGYGQSTGGQNSLYETDYPHAYAQNYSIVYAQYNYWDGGAGSCYTDGTSQFLGEYPLANDPNPYPQLKVAIAQTGSGLVPEIGLGTTDEEQFKEALLRAIAAGHSGNLSQAKDSLAWLITNKPTSAYAPLALLVYGDFSGLKGDVVDANKSVMLESDFHARLAALKDLPQGNPLRPFAVRFLARGAMLAHDVKTASAYSEQLVEEYPGTVHELVSLYDILVTAIEIDEDYAKAHTYLAVLKKKYPDNDLTISASILCGEKVLPGPKKEPEATQTAVLENGLNAAYPNPFNPTTSIVFSLRQDAQVRLTVFDILGREVATLADGMRPAGKHSVVWNARSVTSGVYFARLDVNDEAGNLLYKNTAKLVLTK